MTPLPSRISHYEIVRVLGRGGMGTVYLAMDPGLRRHVALKVLRADSDDQRERFRREARIVARLQHPNIVAIYAVGEHESQLYIAMEYIDGEPLSDAIRRRVPWSLQRKLQMAADLCGGLAFAHRAGVIHRDVKPSNLMVSNGSGTLRLLDFGIARGADAAATAGLTMHGNIVGTLNYMSPEQITGQALDHRSDIFAVGLVLYELLSYRQAFPGDNLATLTYRIVHGYAEPLRELQPELDPELCGIVERAMSRSPTTAIRTSRRCRTDVLRVAARLRPEAAAMLTSGGDVREDVGFGAAPHLVAGARRDRGCERARARAIHGSGGGSRDPCRRRDARRGAGSSSAGGTSIIASLALAVWLVVGRGGPSPGPVAAPDRGGVANPTTVLPPTKDDATETVTPPGPVEAAKDTSTEKAATPPSSAERARRSGTAGRPAIGLDAGHLARPERARATTSRPAGSRTREGERGAPGVRRHHREEQGSSRGDSDACRAARR